VDAAYNYPELQTGMTLLVATMFFAIQIYCDFSGYSDIAIGSARVMGFKLMTNFNRPYFSRNIAEFWKRWHISLSTWFKDYLYISLGGNRVSVPRWYFNLFFVFLVSGLWHGANWTFIIWGAINGFYLVFALVTGKYVHRLEKATGLIHHRRLTQVGNIIITFFLACFAWIFFRANHVEDAFLIIRRIARFDGPVHFENPSMLIFSLLGLVILFGYEYKQEYYKGNFSLLNHPSWVVRYATYTALILLILLMGVFDGGQFIYFQF
jgi:D-alanyl-lipoteichoic acid acyltransferase DltB (MBOAT superfamily)